MNSANVYIFRAAGWGARTSTSSSHWPKVLQSVSLMSASEKECEKTLKGVVDDGQMCTAHKKGEGACFVSANRADFLNEH